MHQHQHSLLASLSSLTPDRSGWGWLGYNAATDRLQIATCANQVSKYTHWQYTHWHNCAHSMCTV